MMRSSLGERRAGRSSSRWRQTGWVSEPLRQIADRVRHWAPQLLGQTRDEQERVDMQADLESGVLFLERLGLSLTPAAIAPGRVKYSAVALIGHLRRTGLLRNGRMLQ